MRGARAWLALSLSTLLALAGAGAGPAAAQGVEPARGTALRSALLEAVRVVAEHDLGAPVEFVVNRLRAEGDVALAVLSAQRPGGGAIDMAAAPMMARDGLSPAEVDGPELVAFLRRGAPGNWQVVAWSTGATDLWWPTYDCPTFRSLLPEEACR